MMRAISQAIAICCFLIFLPTGSANAQVQDFSAYDLSTKDGVNAAREAMAGRQLDEHSKNCVRLDKDLAGIAVVGGFAYDYGCRFSGVFVKTRYFGKDDPGLSQAALDALGWTAANQKQREQLALAWVEKGLLAFFNVVSEKNQDFANRSFQSPQATSKSKGETIVALWILMPSGRSRAEVINCANSNSPLRAVYPTPSRVKPLALIRAATADRRPRAPRP
jgi:hypothetical protein